jgi:CRP/FNR family transcriptional regulator
MAVDLQNIFKITFEPELLQAMNKVARVTKVKAGETILDMGQPVRVIPIVLNGTVKVTRMDEDGRELLLYYINPNESCAMTFTCCMMQHESEIRAVAEEEVELLAIPMRVMDEWISKYPTWKSFVMKTIRNRFSEFIKTIDDLAFKKLDERLISYLKEKSRATKSSLINLSHQQIADELATSRVVISRLLKQLEIEEKLLLYRNQIKLLKEL